MLVESEPPLHYEPVSDTWRAATARRNDAPVVATATTVSGVSTPPEQRLSCMDLAMAIQQARVAARLSQQELALATDSTAAEIRAIESRRAQFPPRALLQKISKTLGVVFV